MREELLLHDISRFVREFRIEITDRIKKRTEHLEKSFGYSLERLV